jgi:hypothetical protein
MNRIILLTVLGSALIWGLVLPHEETSAQTTKDLVGTWSLVSVTVEQDGQKRDVQGPNPKGVLMLDNGGHFAVLTFRADQPKFASNNRLEATAEESKTLLSGTLAHFGTYSEANNVLVFHIERSTFPNWDGIEQKRGTGAWPGNRQTPVTRLG